jgi:GntR family transcriptional regulator
MTVDFSNLAAHLADMGARTRARLLSFGYEPASIVISDALGIAPGARVQRSVRVRYVEDAPLSHLTTHVPEPVAARISEADMATTPLFVLLERAGVSLARARQTVSATLADPETAAALDLAVGAPLIAITRVVFDADGAGVEHLAALYRPDRYRFDMELARVGDGAGRHWEPESLNGGLSG